ncbi:MAG TPA: hypothetical protein VHY91_14575 [Pirellulales bacterium]|nr:hypothetical protein [Pirellulales bacterium]
MELSDWVNTLYADPKGEIPLIDLHAAFTKGMTAHERRAWPRKAVERELGDRIVSRGRADRPVKYVVGYSFALPQVNAALARRVEKLLSDNLVMRWEDRSTLVCEGKTVYTDVVVLERPDYTPERYRLTYGEIAERLRSERVDTDAATVRAIVLAIAKTNEADSRDPFWDYEHVERMLNRHVRCVTHEGLVNYRWRRPGEPKDAEEAGYPLPREGETEIRYHMPSG